MAGQMYRRARQFRHSFSQLSASAPPLSPEPTIAVHYVEGVDSTRRSELFWYGGDSIDPQRILILFDSNRGAHQDHRIPESVLQEIEGRGMRWVSLEPNMVERSSISAWSCDPSGKALLTEFQQRKVISAGAIDHWAIRASEWLLRQVDYWVGFYRAFMVKVHVDAADAEDEHMAQSIALDLTDGARVGWQRSEQTTEDGTHIGHHSNHVYFTWSSRALANTAAGRHKIGPVLVSGFPYDGTWKSDAGPKELRARLAERGAHFVVALFDNVIIRDGHHSKAMLLSLYRSFLEWVIEEPRVGVLNKSKKPVVLQQLPEIQELMAKAEATGRWTNLADIFGRLPSDASRAADISVGFGISSAATEAVAAGGKAIHCDLPGQTFHPFYQWGYEKVVFDDLERMMAALKRHVADPESEPGLGDFSPFIDQIDPFRDGRAGERIGEYISNLLKDFDSGLSREQAIQRANAQYAENWGSKHVIRYDVHLSATEG